MPFAKRTEWPLSVNKLSSDLGHLRDKQVPILDLTESNPTQCDFSYLKNGLYQSLAVRDNLQYSPSPRGDLKAREAVCRYYRDKGHTVFPEQIFLTASTSEAYTYLFRLLVDPGEQVLFPRPSYPLFTFLADLNDVSIDTYPLVYDGKWQADMDGVRDILTDQTKALVLVNPNNPTGSFVKISEIKEINKLCRKKNIAVICDEVFSDFSFDQEKDHTSLVNNDEILTFVLGGISKTLGLPQMKLSWIIISGPKKLTETAAARLEVIADTYLSVNTPTQNALPAWLLHRTAIQCEINGRIRQNYHFINEQVGHVKGCDLLHTQGGWYAVLQIPDVYSEEEWALMFLHQDNVYVHPGYFFDFDSEAYIVVSLLPASQVFEEGVKRILGRIQSIAQI